MAERRVSAVAEGGIAVVTQRRKGDANAFAQGLFGGISGSYGFWAQALSFLQYLRWRRFLVSRLKLGRGALALDVSTGTAGVAIEMARRSQGRIVGLDVTRPMLLAGLSTVDREGLDGRVALVEGRAEELPFPDETFDAVVFTFLLRYVREPEVTIREMARVLKPGGQLLSLEFGVPENALACALWVFYTRAVMPLVTVPVSRGWRRVGSFLGPNISDFYRRYYLEQLTDMWRRCGINPVETARPSLGGAVVMWGVKEGRRGNR